MVYLLAIPFTFLILWGIIRISKGWTAKKEDGKPSTEGEECAIIFGSIFLFILLLVCGCMTLFNGNKLYELQAFYDANSRNYQFAVDETASYLSTEKYLEEVLIPVEGSIEKLELAGYVSARITEWRNVVNSYNTKIASMQYYNQNPFTGVLYPNGVEDMKLLVIE